MTTRRLNTMDLHALLRRLRAGETNQAVARALGLDRKTVRKYRRWATAHGLRTGDLPDLARLHALARETLGDGQPRQNHPKLDAFRDDVAGWLEQGLGPRTIYQKLCARPDFAASESAVWRFVARLRPPTPPEPVPRQRRWAVHHAG